MATTESTTRRTTHEEIARHIPIGLEIGLRNYWYPVLRTDQVPADRPVGFKALNESLVAWRDLDGRPHVARDKCPHRGAKFSVGRVLAGDLQCAWHGLRFDGSGRCTLIPWEPDDSPLKNDVRVQTYPAADLGGWLWCYIGEPEKFPPPSLASVVPEELQKPDEFIVFTHPIGVWEANWLQALDGSDGFHAVMLHSESQPVVRGASPPAQPMRTPPPLADRRMRIVKTPQGLRGIALDPAGNHIVHGHFMDGWRGDRWTLPCLFTIPIAPAPHLPSFVARVYQFAIDATHTQSSRWVAMRAATDAERTHCTRIWDEVVGPRQRQVLAEDQVIVESLGDLTASRAEEYLFSADQDVLAVRRMMAEAFLAQQRGERPMPGPEAFVFPY